VIIDKCKVSHEDNAKVIKIMLRAASLMNFEILDASRLDIVMDLTVCHCLACPLNLDGLLKANGGDLIHDVSGIVRHLNRDTGKLEDCFVPRFARENAHARDPWNVATDDVFPY